MPGRQRFRTAYKREYVNHLGVVLAAAASFGVLPLASAQPVGETFTVELRAPDQTSTVWIDLESADVAEAGVAATLGGDELEFRDTILGVTAVSALSAGDTVFEISVDQSVEVKLFIAFVAESGDVLESEASVQELEGSTPTDTASPSPIDPGSSTPSPSAPPSESESPSESEVPSGSSSPSQSADSPDTTPEISSSPTSSEPKVAVPDSPSPESSDSASPSVEAAGEDAAEEPDEEGGLALTGTNVAVLSGAVVLLISAGIGFTLRNRARKAGAL